MSYSRCGLFIAAALMSCAGAVPVLAAMPTGSTGLGVILGEPTGFSGAYTLSPKTTIDAALAYSFVREGDWQIQSDYLFTGNRLFSSQPDNVDTYIGAGLRLKFESSARFGVRVPLGATYQFDDQPVQAFGEFVPILDLAPGTDVSVDVAVGIRYFF